MSKETSAEKKKMINLEQHKCIMLDILKYFDMICRMNNIKYSLDGGSLIGAIRHNGFIPWDDDIDVILTKENYDKLKEILDKEEGRYQTLKDGEGGERFSFMKFVDTKTRLIELEHSDFGKKYGIFIDIFCYYNLPNDENERKRHYKKLSRLRSLLKRPKLNLKDNTLGQYLKKNFKKSLSIMIGYRKIKKIFNKMINEYNDIDARYLMSNCPMYGYEKDICLKKDTEEYIDVEFEGLKVMAFKNYDEILRTMFGNYMQLPPESERVPKHNMVMWWREDDNE